MTDQNKETQNPYVVSVEIRGIIYLYNPPDKTTLGTGAVAEQIASGGATPDGTTPTGTPSGTPPGTPTTPETSALPETPTPGAP